MSDTPKETRADKKKRIMARNRRHQLINLMAWEHEAQAESGMLEAPRYDPEKAKKSSREAAIAKAKTEGGGEQQVWSAKVGEVRNRVTGKKRAALDRWNRFAGTSGGGGRGR